jgi:hypothetical protein
LEVVATGGDYTADTLSMSSGDINILLLTTIKLVLPAVTNGRGINNCDLQFIIVVVIEVVGIALEVVRGLGFTVLT